MVIDLASRIQQPFTRNLYKLAAPLWPKRVLIEMKFRGEKLEKHCDQTFDNWTHIVPHRPCCGQRIEVVISLGCLFLLLILRSLAEPLAALAPRAPAGAVFHAGGEASHRGDVGEAQQRELRVCDDRREDVELDGREDRTGGVKPVLSTCQSLQFPVILANTGNHG